MAGVQFQVSGQNIGAELRDPIIRLREAVTAGQSVSAEAESKFLNAYARLAVLVAPVTAATLRATSRHYQSDAWLARVFRVQTMSAAQFASFLFGFLAICLLVTIGIGEGIRTFIAAVISSQEEVLKVREEMRAGKLALQGLDEQLKALSAILAKAEITGQNLRIRRKGKMLSLVTIRSDKVPNVLLLLETMEKLGVGAGSVPAVDPLARVRI